MSRCCSHDLRYSSVHHASGNQFVLCTQTREGNNVCFVLGRGGVLARVALFARICCQVTRKGQQAIRTYYYISISLLDRVNPLARQSCMYLSHYYFGPSLGRVSQSRVSKAYNTPLPFVPDHRLSRNGASVHLSAWKVVVQTMLRTPWMYPRRRRSTYIKSSGQDAGFRRPVLLLSIYRVGNTEREFA